MGLAGTALGESLQLLGARAPTLSELPSPQGSGSLQELRGEGMY